MNSYDLRTNERYSALYAAHLDRHLITICACDGGLVCFMYKLEDLYMDLRRQEGLGLQEEDMVRFAVWNPATGGEAALPQIHVDPEDERYQYDGRPRKFDRIHNHPRAVLFSVDRETKDFKLMVVTGAGGQV